MTKLTHVDPEAALRTEVAYWIATHPYESKTAMTCGFARAKGPGVSYAVVQKLFNEAFEKGGSVSTLA